MHPDDAVVFAIEPDLAVQRILVPPSGRNRQMVAGSAAAILGADQGEVIVSGNDVDLLFVLFGVGFVFSFQDLVEDAGADECRSLLAGDGGLRRKTVCTYIVESVLKRIFAA
jgi:hypothetical protein